MVLNHVSLDVSEGHILAIAGANGAVEAVFVVEKGYAEKLEAGEYDDAVRLYLSPYSTSARTLSDAVAAIVMRQWLEAAVRSKAAGAEDRDAMLDRFAARGAFAGYWLARAIGGDMAAGLIPLCLCAAVGIAAGIFTIELRHRRR